MKTFAIYKIESDACGNYDEYIEYYIKANSIEEANNYVLSKYGKGFFIKYEAREIEIREIK